jgi:hypothetical protein
VIHYTNPCEREDCRAMRDLLHRPEIQEFLLGVKLEAAHQLLRWGTEHDRTKGPEDWYWTVGHLAGKALHAQRADDDGKFMHHLISTAAVLANWHYFASNPDPLEITCGTAGNATTSTSEATHPTAKVAEPSEAAPSPPGKEAI